MVSMTSIRRSRRASAEWASALLATKKKSREVAAEARGDVGPQHLDRNRLAHAVCLDLAAMYLRDRGRRHRRAEARKSLCHGPFQRCRDHGLGLCLRKRRQPVLQAFQIARHGDADDIGARGQELSELEIGGTEPRQRARQPRAGFRAAALDQPGHAQRKLSGRRHQRGIDDAEHALAREHECGARQPRGMGQCGDHKRQPECSATMPPERACQLTRAKPASRIISAKAFGFGNLRIDSTRY